MGKWLATTTLQWREPQAHVRRSAHEMLKAWPWRLWIGFPFVFVALAGAIDPEHFHLGTPESRSEVWQALQRLGAAFAMPFVVWLMLWILPSYVMVTDKGITSTGSRWMLLQDIDRCELDEVEVDHRRMAVMDVISPKGAKRRLAIPDSLSLRRIEEALKRQGIRVVRRPAARY